MNIMSHTESIFDWAVTQGRRDRQQDILSVGGNVAIVADGVGSISDSDELAEIAVSVAFDALIARPTDAFGAIRAAQNELSDPQYERWHAFPSAATTMVAVAALDDEWRWAHIGDSLLLHFHDGALSLLNMQHESWDGSLNRWLGYPFHQSPDHGSLPREGKLILATDGVQVRGVEDFDDAWRWMESALCDGANAHDLVQRSLDHGSTDNIAVVVVS